MDYLWVEKYRPSNIDGYVFKDENQRKQIEEWIKNGKVSGHLLLSGAPGVGKTTLAKLLFNEFKVKKGDILELNASEQRSIEMLRDKIINFCASYSLSGGLKYVLLDEADMLPQLTQAALRNVMEKYHDTVRFILTCNYPNKILPALHSRCQGYHFSTLNREEFDERIVSILAEEGVDFDVDTLTSYLDSTYPDMRKCLNSLQQNSITGKLTSLNETIAVQDYLIDSVDLIRKNRVTEARILICKQSRQEEYDSIYKWMYQNLDLWGNSEEKQNQAIITIAKYLRNDALVADREINLAACFCELNEQMK